ncbi:MAG: YkgJ family cysteine cluster protein, partial [Syntrophomonadaceae bacterium]|nr:YkgJ family cysteine cluster protein [Syntrophomonadaceae bacterium]
MSKVSICQNEDKGKILLGIKVEDDSASLQDLLDAWQPLCDDTLIHKEYAAACHDACKACQVNCCNSAYVIPDLIAFKKIAAQLDLDYRDFIRQFFQKEKLAVGLLRLNPDPCIFLQERICSIYALRSLICRFYICTPLQGQTEELIYKISWAGAAATQVFAEQQGLLARIGGASRSSFDLLFLQLLEQYRHTQMVESF